MKTKQLRNKEEKEKQNSLFHLSSKDISDISVLDMNYRIVVDFSPLGEKIPLLIKLEDIKYTETTNKIDTNGEVLYEIFSKIREENLTKIIDSFFNVIEWEVFNFEDSDEDLRDIKNKIILKNTRHTAYGDVLNNKKIDKEWREVVEETIYNLKLDILDRCFVDTDIENELFVIFNKIHKVKVKLINEFNELVDTIMDFENDKDIFFNNIFTVMLKAGVVNSTQPIFKENVGKAFTEYSYREIKLRMSFEHKETMLNSNKMNQMLPLVARGGGLAGLL